MAYQINQIDQSINDVVVFLYRTSFLDTERQIISVVFRMNTTNFH